VVCLLPDEPQLDMIALVTALVDKSLLRRSERPEGITRFSLLETIREFALEQLVGAGELVHVQRQHADYFYGMAYDHESDERDEPFLAELDNLRAALEWAEQGDADLAIRLTWSLAWFWYRQGYWREALAWLPRVGAQCDERKHGFYKADFLFYQGLISQFRGSVDHGRALMEQSLALFRGLGLRNETVKLLNNLAVVEREHGRPERAIPLLEEAITIIEQDGEGRVDWVEVTLAEVVMDQGDLARATELLGPSLAELRKRGWQVMVGWALNHLGHVAQLEGNFERAEALHSEALPIFLNGDEQGIAWSHEGLGQAALAQGDLKQARAHFIESMRVFQELGDSAITWSLAGLASIALLNEEPERAAMIWGAVAALRAKSGRRWAPTSKARYERELASARAQLGDEAFEAAWAAGGAMSHDQVLVQALGEE
jgi:tetratricopeptide (TPR) repeat protein